MEDRLTSVEAIMWAVGHDATLRMTVGALVILDRSPTASLLAERLAVVAAREPRLRSRPYESRTMFSRPVWVEDFDTDTGFHLRSLSVAAPGSRRQVLDLVSLVESVPFDPDRSPWDVNLIEGVEGGRAALYLRAHHVLTDGFGGIYLLRQLFDDRGSPKSAAASAGTGATTEPTDTERIEHRFGTVTMTIDVPRVVRRVADRVNTIRDVDPVVSAVRGFQRVLDLANSVSRQAVVTGGPLTPVPPTRSLLSRFELLSVDGTRATALRLGGSRNDLLVAAAATGLGRYHERLGHQTPQLRLATPAGHRLDPERGANWIVPTRVEIPTAVARPGTQFGVVVERLAGARREPALRVVSALASTISRLPTRLLVPTLQAQADSVDFAVTALPGLRGPRELCGAKVEAFYPFGPRLGCPINITAASNDGGLDIGIALDPAAISRPELLLECLTDSFGSFASPSVDPAVAAGHGSERRDTD
jgi:diacylglycerol O-acyltransferase / wax synthase